MVITLDFESSNPGSNPGRTSFFAFFLLKQKHDAFPIRFEDGSKKRMHNAGFEPAPPKRSRPERDALDHSANCAKKMPRVGFEPTPTS